MEVSGLLPALAALPARKNSRQPLNRRLGGTQSYSCRFEQENYLHVNNYKHGSYAKIQGHKRVKELPFQNPEFTLLQIVHKIALVNCLIINL